MIKKPKGFTLVELLVVIAVIAILAVIGLTVFSGVQKGSRDAKRKADVQAIASALETKRDMVAGTYSAVAGADFSSGALPLDPINTGTSVYTTTLSTDSKNYCVCALLENTAGANANSAGAAGVCSFTQTSPTYFCVKQQQ